MEKKNKAEVRNNKKKLILIRNGTVSDCIAFGIDHWKSFRP